MQRGFAVAVGHTGHFPKEELEMAQNWQRRTDILRDRVPEVGSKSFVCAVALLMISTSCTFQFPGRAGLVVSNRAATMQTLCISQGGVGRERNYFLLISQKRKPSPASAFILFLFCEHEGQRLGAKLAVCEFPQSVPPLHGRTPPRSASKHIRAARWLCSQMQQPFHIQQRFLPSCSARRKNQ